MEAAHYVSVCLMTITLRRIYLDTDRCTTMQVYDLAWSPTGEYIIAGSTDNCARIFAVNDGMDQFFTFIDHLLTPDTGKCVHEIAEHNHYVQGVTWDPLNEYIATQSSDRSMHIYSISYKQGGLEVHAIGKNTKMMHRHSHSHSRTPSRPSLYRRESTASEAESSLGVAEPLKEDYAPSSSQPPALLTPTPSVPSTPSTSMFPPPPVERSSSRRSSFSSSNAPGSPATYTRYARSPSPMPALPAIRMPPTPAATWSSVKLYGDESYTNFFRRLTFSPDGGLLLTPAGQFEDPSVTPSPSKGADEQRGRKGHPSGDASAQASTSSVYIYSRANFARPPIARIPGHKKASVAVKFSPILYELRSGVTDGESFFEPKTVLVERGVDKAVDIDIADSKAQASQTLEATASSPMKHMTPAPATSPIIAPSPKIAIPPTPQSATMPSPALSAADSLRPPTPAASKPATPAITPTSQGTASIFALPYRMLYAVATMDTITIHDTQQAGPVCLFTKLHYDEFTDMSW